jgi:hypothetical protein
MSDHGLHGLMKFVEQADDVAVAVFLGEVGDRDGWGILLAFVAHAVLPKHGEHLGMRLDQISNRRLFIDACHECLPLM